MHAHSQPTDWRYIASQYLALTKPRIVLLAAFCALIGMLLASDGMVPWPILVFGTLGIALLAASGFAFNCLIERHIDARMARTRGRPSASGEVGVPGHTLFATVLAVLGAFVLYVFVNPLTMWLTLATFVGYAIVYTVILKPLTPQNIVIGGASGAMPPVLGWAAMRNDVGPEAMLLCLIIFLWTPPHFWALALRYRNDYAAANVPMLPVVRGEAETARQIVVYTVVLVAVSLLLLPVAGMGAIYLVAAVVLGALYLWGAVRLRSQASDGAAAIRLFRYSISYLTLLFAAVAVDALVRVPLT